MLVLLCTVFCVKFLQQYLYFHIFTNEQCVSKYLCYLYAIFMTTALICVLVNA